MTAVYGRSIEEYYHGEFAAAYVSKSGLDTFAKSPAIYYARHLDPDRPPRPEPTPAMVLGTMTHCAVLEPDTFADRYAIAPKFDRRTTAGKADDAAFRAALKYGQEIAEKIMVDQAHAMAASVRRIAPVAQLLASGDAEVSAYFTEPASGVQCRIRPDWVSPAGDGVILADLKTCLDASPAGFARAVANFSYDLQAAFYSDGWEYATGQKVHGFVFMAVEKEHPFAAAPYMLDESDIDRARRKYGRLLMAYAECLRSNVWPGYTQPEEIRLLKLPTWATKEGEE